MATCGTAFLHRTILVDGRQPCRETLVARFACEGLTFAQHWIHRRRCGATVESGVVILYGFADEASYVERDAENKRGCQRSRDATCAILVRPDVAHASNHDDRHRIVDVGHPCGVFSGFTVVPVSPRRRCCYKHRRQSGIGGEYFDRSNEKIGHLLRTGFASSTGFRVKFPQWQRAQPTPLPSGRKRLLRGCSRRGH
jgi:hypothetical protein